MQSVFNFFPCGNPCQELARMPQFMTSWTQAISWLHKSTPTTHRPPNTPTSASKLATETHRTGTYIQYSTQREKKERRTLTGVMKFSSWWKVLLGGKGQDQLNWQSNGLSGPIHPSRLARVCSPASWPGRGACTRPWYSLLTLYLRTRTSRRKYWK